MSYDRVLGPEETQASTYNAVTDNLLQSILSGVNATVCAYGPSGAGKTHTIFGPLDSWVADPETPRSSHSDEGIVPRLVRSLFHNLTAQPSPSMRNQGVPLVSKVHVSFLQIYVERITDLLVQVPSPNDGDDSGEDVESESRVGSEFGAASPGAASSPSFRRGIAADGGRRRHAGGARPGAAALARAGNVSAWAHDDPALWLQWHNNTAAHNSSHSTMSDDDRAFQGTAGQWRPPRGLSLRERPASAGGGWMVPGLRWIRAHTAQELLDVLLAGLRARATAATALNASSSRSHAILRIRVETNEALPEEESHRADRTMRHVPVRTRRSLLTIADLAGSERVSQSRSEGIRLNEAKSINRSISTLGSVVAELARAAQRSTKLGRGAQKHVPFRDSTLTRLLHTSLTGHAQVRICVCVSPAQVHHEVTRPALQFGLRARQIPVRPEVHEATRQRRRDVLEREMLREQERVLRHSQSPPDRRIGRRRKQRSAPRRLSRRANSASPVRSPRRNGSPKRNRAGRSPTARSDASWTARPSGPHRAHSVPPTLRRPSASSSSSSLANSMDRDAWVRRNQRLESEALELRDLLVGTRTARGVPERAAAIMLGRARPGKEVEEGGEEKEEEERRDGAGGAPRGPSLLAGEECGVEEQAGDEGCYRGERERVQEHLYEEAKDGVAERGGQYETDDTGHPLARSDLEDGMHRSLVGSGRGHASALPSWRPSPIPTGTAGQTALETLAATGTPPPVKGSHGRVAELEETVRRQAEEIEYLRQALRDARATARQAIDHAEHVGQIALSAQRGRLKSPRQRGKKRHSIV